jgi:hypothetical protein
MPRKKIPAQEIEAACLRNALVPREAESSARLLGVKGPSRIMFIENKSEGEAHIGRVTFSKSGSTLYYRGLAFKSLKGSGFKANYLETTTGAYYWISGPKKDGLDRLYGKRVGVAVDEDVREEYWCEIRNLPARRHDDVT